MSQTQILVVEDESIVAKDIERRLKNAGYLVADVCSKGREAIQATEATRPDLVLMEVGLGGRYLTD